MSDEKKTPAGPEAPKDKELKNLDKKHFEDQIKIATSVVQQSQQQIVSLQEQIQRQLGVIGYAEHLLKTFNIPEAPKEDPKKKTELEVK